MKNGTVLELLPEDKCTGCGLCVNICPFKAVSLTENELGVPVRKIDINKCVGCGKCSENCPQLHNPLLIKPSGCYAVYPKEEYRNGNYASGGAASLIAKSFLQRGGLVCGCAWNADERRAVHILIDSEEDLSKLYGSKYVQSSIVDVFQLIQSKLDMNKEVLFIGTPCQVDAIKRFFPSKYLYTIDLICHGVPPSVYLKNYLEEYVKSPNFCDVRFRGVDDFWLTVKKSNGHIAYKQYHNCDPYFLSFLNGVTYRENCFDCPYARIERIADLTVGDFWGLDASEIHYTGRISLVLQNTKLGQKLLDFADSFIESEARDINEAISGNMQLSAPMPRTLQRDEFKKAYAAKKNYCKSMRNCSFYYEAKRNKKKMEIAVFKTKVKIFLQKFFKR